MWGEKLFQKMFVDVANVFCLLFYSLLKSAIVYYSKFQLII